jgi:hypothetical protein
VIAGAGLGGLAPVRLRGRGTSAGRRRRRRHPVGVRGRGRGRIDAQRRAFCLHRFLCIVLFLDPRTDVVRLGAKVSVERRLRPRFVQALADARGCRRVRGREQRDHGLRERGVGSCSS